MSNEKLINKWQPILSAVECPNDRQLLLVQCLENTQHNLKLSDDDNVVNNINIITIPVTSRYIRLLNIFDVVSTYPMTGPVSYIDVSNNNRYMCEALTCKIGNYTCISNNLFESNIDLNNIVYSIVNYIDKFIITKLLDVITNNTMWCSLSTLNEDIFNNSNVVVADENTANILFDKFGDKSTKQEINKSFTLSFVGYLNNNKQKLFINNTAESQYFIVGNNKCDAIIYAPYVPCIINACGPNCFSLRSRNGLLINPNINDHYKMYKFM